MKRFVLFASLLSMVFFIVHGFAVYADEMPKDMKPIKLIFSTYDAQTADGGVAVERFMDRITKRTNGLVTFRAYFSSAMGKAQEIFPSVSSGMVQLGYSRTMYYPGKFHLATIDELPFTGYQMDARQKAYMQLVSEFPSLKEEFAKQNLKLLTPLQSNSAALASKKLIMKLEDFKGNKIRSGGTSAILVKDWGGVPVSIATANIYEALERGTVDGVFGFPPQTMVAYGLHQVAKYFLDTGIGALGMLSFVINLDTYNKFPPVVKKIFDEEARTIGEEYPEIRMEGMRRAIPKVLAAGDEIITMPEETRNKLAELGKKDLHEAWVKDLVAKGYDEALLRKMLSRMMELYDQFAARSSFKDFWALYEAEFKK
jgi:TRAP-type transport system periplasmic protein